MLIGGIFIIAFAGLGMAYSRQNQDQSRLNQELAQAQLILDKSSPDELSAQKDELETKLAESRSQLEAHKVSLSPVVQSIEASDSIFDIAEKCNVEVVAAKSKPPSKDELNGIEYSTLWIKIKLEGNVDDIIRFIHTWTEENSTGIVESVKINVPEILEEEAIEEEGEEIGENGEEEEEAGEEEGEAGEEETEEQKPSADIELIIHTLSR